MTVIDTRSSFVDVPFPDAGAPAIMIFSASPVEVSVVAYSRLSICGTPHRKGECVAVCGGTNAFVALNSRVAQNPSHKRED